MQHVTATLIGITLLLTSCKRASEQTATSPETKPENKEKLHPETEAAPVLAGEVAQIWIAGDYGWRLNATTANKIENKAAEEYAAALQDKRRVKINVGLWQRGKMVALVDAKGKALRVFMIHHAARAQPPDVARHRNHAQEMKFTQSLNGDIVGNDYTTIHYEGVAIPKELHEAAHK